MALEMAFEADLPHNNNAVDNSVQLSLNFNGEQFSQQDQSMSADP